jgi:hypothetical protein
MFLSITRMLSRHSSSDSFGRNTSAWAKRDGVTGRIVQTGEWSPRRYPRASGRSGCGCRWFRPLRSGLSPVVLVMLDDRKPRSSFDIKRVGDWAQRSGHQGLGCLRERHQAKAEIPEPVVRGIPVAIGAANDSAIVQERAAPHHAGLAFCIHIFPPILRIIGVLEV